MLTHIHLLLTINTFSIHFDIDPNKHLPKGGYIYAITRSGMNLSVVLQSHENNR